MRTIFRHARGNAIAYAALFVALGGSGYAAMSLPKGSVGARQIKNHSIAPVKFNGKSITGSVRAWALVDSNGQLVAGGGKPKSGTTPTPGTYEISWGVNFAKHCATVASIDGDHSPVTERIPLQGNPSAAFTAGYAVADSSTSGKGRSRNVSFVDTFAQNGVPTPLGFDIAVIC